MEGPRQAPCERQASSQWDPPLWTPLPGPYVSKRANAVAAVMAGEDWLAVCRAYGGVYCMPPALLPPATHTGAMSKRDWEKKMAAWRAAIRREHQRKRSFHAAGEATSTQRKRPRLTPVAVDHVAAASSQGAETSRPPSELPTVTIFGPSPVASLEVKGATSAYKKGKGQGSRSRACSFGFEPRS